MLIGQSLKVTAPGFRLYLFHLLYLMNAFPAKPVTVNELPTWFTQIR